MKNNKKLFLATVVILGITWLIVMLMVCNLSSAGAVGTVGLVFGLLGFAVVCGMNLMHGNGQVRNDASAFIIPFAVSVGYLGFSVILNTVLMVVSSFIPPVFSGMTAIAVAVNVVLLAAFCLYSMYSLAYLGGLRYKDQVVRESTRRPAEISAMLGNALAMTDNADVKAALRRLKETVDYSTNTSAKMSADTEEAFESKIADIQAAIRNGDAADKIIAKIEGAARIWRGRNASVN